MAQDPATAELIENIIVLTDKAFRRLFPKIPKEWLHFDITMPQLKVVLLLFMNGSSRMSVIASALDVSLATATGVVDRLVERDILLREGDPGDRRVVVCRLSENGQTVLSELWHVSQEHMRELLEAADPRQLPRISEMMEILLKTEEMAGKGEKRKEVHQTL